MEQQARHEPRRGRGAADRPSPPALPLVGRTAFRRAVRSTDAARPHAVFVVHVERSHDVATHCGGGARDALLASVTTRIAEHGTPWRSACRLGDERIALLKVGCGPADALRLARCLHDALDGAAFRWQDLSFRLGATVAVVEMGGRADRLDDLLERAAQACSLTRALGSDGVTILTGRPGEQGALEREREWREHVNEVLG